MSFRSISLKKFSILFLSCFFIPVFVYGQKQIENKEIFSTFLDTTEKSLVMVGENHSSSVGSTIYPELIEFLNKENGLNTLLIEFGSSEAYFYDLYLQTGEEKWLNYTIFGGAYKDWKKAWRRIYKFNNTLDRSLEIRGIDFERARTFGYALYKIFSGYDERPQFVDSLMSVVSDTTFYNTHTIGYPTERDKKFISNTRVLLKENRSTIKKMVNDHEFVFIDGMIKNQAMDYGKNREKNIARNTQHIIEVESADDFLLLIGRDHAYRDAIYDDKPRLVSLLHSNSSIKTLAGVILHENSQQWGKDNEEPITLFEVRDKKPWKEYYQKIDGKAKKEITVIPLRDDLKPLASYTDYIIVARNQGPVNF